MDVCVGEGGGGGGRRRRFFLLSLNFAHLKSTACIKQGQIPLHNCR